MNSIPFSPGLRAGALALSMVGLVALATSVRAGDVPHLTVIEPGGMPGRPIITGIQPATNGVTVMWDGPSGYFRLYEKAGLDGQWQPIGAPTFDRQATVTTLYSNAFFKVGAAAPNYAGSAACAECHQGVHDRVMLTAHANAFQALANVKQGTNTSCLACHTVGYGLPTGFVSKFDPKTYPRLAGVQCENCHGPAGNHAANPDDLTVRPRIEVAGTMCGGCHNTQFVPSEAAQYHSHNSTYEDWSQSGHGTVVPDVKEDFEGSRGPTTYIPTCGRCHSGTVREAHLENEPLPDGHEAGAVGVACAVCHDPHEADSHTNVLNGTFAFTNLLTGRRIVLTNTNLGAVYTNQVLYPFASLADYHTSGDFATNYNPQINVCGQCHNDRAASWTASSRPPHHSPQYNMLLGTIGATAGTGAPSLPGTHSQLEKQCVTCHMPMTNGLSGHRFEVASFSACTKCHTDPAGVIQVTTNGIATQIAYVRSLLDFWAQTKASSLGLTSTFDAPAWEYTAPGDLSAGSAGPGAADQNKIPANIRKARYNLYVVHLDGSAGVHNAPFAVQLLDDAAGWVTTELSQ